MFLLALANELLHIMSKDLQSERDINAFAQANCRLYRLLNCYLYRYSIQQSGSSALLWAAEHGHEGTVRTLLEEGARVQITTNYNQTPLLLAAKQGHTTVVELLLNEGDMDPNARNEGGQTPLLCAAKRGHEQVVKLLLDRGANTNAKGGNALNAAPS